MRLTDARALDPSWSPSPADPAGDAALLKRLARWAGRWSPLVEVDGDDGLRLDVSGVAHLFGGEAGWRGYAGALRRARPDRARGDRADRRRGLGVGAVRTAAWPTRRGVALRPLAPLPVAALAARARGSVQILERLGLKTIGTAGGMPRKGLQRRFREADNPLDALDRALGRKPSR